MIGNDNACSRWDIVPAGDRSPRRHAFYQSKYIYQYKIDHGIALYRRSYICDIPDAAIGRYQQPEGLR
jgi:hypothetical protein